MAKTLQMTFTTGDNKRSTVTLDQPKENLDAATVEQAMTTMVNAQVFANKDGAFSAPFSAQYVERTVTEIIAPQP